MANATSIPSSNASIHISSSTTSRSSTAASSSSFVSSHGASLLTSSLSATQTTSETTTPSTTGIERRTAIAACLNDVEVSCYNLAANCIDSVNGGVRHSLRFLMKPLTHPNDLESEHNLEYSILCCCCHLLWGLCYTDSISCAQTLMSL